METSTGNQVGVRPARRVRLIEHGGIVVAYPEPHRTPVLPPGWAPLSRDQQEAVLQACDAAPECLIFKLGSLWEPGCEYRVYRLATEKWAGLSVVCKFAAADARRYAEAVRSPVWRSVQRTAAGPGLGAACRPADRDGLLQLGPRSARPNLAAQRPGHARRAVVALSFRLKAEATWFRSCSIPWLPPSGGRS